MTREITNTDNLIDSREVIARIEELESEIEEYREAGDEDYAGELMEELEPLKAFAEEAEGCTPDWLYGAALIHDDYFEEYAEQLARDIYDLPEHWPVCHIDWEAAANALKMDYTAIDFNGETYWTRS
ncbi:MAG: hypothetical protein R3253_02695 [Longimicrobiales bacterium]|nr:hypothetical protein [Longimicrobiales bacterium]